MSLETGPDIQHGTARHSPALPSAPEYGTNQRPCSNAIFQSGQGGKNSQKIQLENSARPLAALARWPSKNVSMTMTAKTGLLAARLTEVEATAKK